MIPSLTFKVSLHAPCCGAHQPIPCVKPEISLISLEYTHFPSSGIGAHPCDALYDLQCTFLQLLM